MKKENKRKVDRKLKSEISSVLCCIEITLQKYLQTRKKKEIGNYIRGQHQSQHQLLQRGGNGLMAGIFPSATDLAILL
jgi:hypothetical protein